MKRVLIFVLVFVPLLGAAETVVDIETSRGAISLSVPETYEELQSSYIEMAKLYLEERFDHEMTIENYEQLRQEYETINDVNAALKENVSVLTDELRRSRRVEVIQSQIVGASGYNPSWPLQVSGAVAYQAILKERLIVGFDIGIPIQARVLVGWQF